MKKKLLLLVCAWAVLLVGTTAWADFYVVAMPGGVGTRIPNLPYTITNPGFYYLAHNLTSTENGITVNADDVTIDLMGFSLLSSGGLNWVGIIISGRKNVEVRNGTVRGFNAGGIYDQTGGYSYRFINLRLENNGIWGIALSTGYYHLIQNCNITENGNSGITLTGYGCMVTGNVVSKNGLRGIACGGSGNSLIGNVVVDNATHGFYLSTGASAYYLIDRNTAYNNTSGTLNGIPPAAKFGVNAGPGFP
ncbi:MAG: right-handed parallel beta-helix repeat-containing protein [Desulfobaccales bacterium]